MRVISFDVGIKNLAYCVMDISTDVFPKIVDWNVINLCESMDVPSLPSYCCSHLLKNKKQCGKKAKYKQPDTPQKEETEQEDSREIVYHCEKHAKEHTRWRLPTKEFSLTALKKQPVEKIKHLREEWLPSSKHLARKMDIIMELIRYFEGCTWKPLLEKKKVNAGAVDLVTIGRALHRELSKNEICRDGSLTHVIIENQISPIANRMKTIQGMIAQHFIGMGICHIEFVSSGNKLREFKEISEGKTVYQKHKKDGVYYCQRLLENSLEENKTKWIAFFSQYGSKKDDLADCLLQGIWWWKKQKNQR